MRIVLANPFKTRIIAEAHIIVTVVGCRRTPYARDETSMNACVSSARRSGRVVVEIGALFTLLPLPALSKSNSNAQEGGGNGGGVLARAFVLAVEQIFQLLLQISCPTVLLRGFKTKGREHQMLKIPLITSNVPLVTIRLTNLRLFDLQGGLRI
jgi:hypothetical protein